MLSRLPGTRTVRSIHDRSPARSLGKSLFSGCGLLVVEPAHDRVSLGANRFVRIHVIMQVLLTLRGKIPLRKSSSPQATYSRPHYTPSSCRGSRHYELPNSFVSDRSMGSKEHSEGGLMQKYRRSDDT